MNTDMKPTKYILIEWGCSDFVGPYTVEELAEYIKEIDHEYQETGKVSNDSKYFYLSTEVFDDRHSGYTLIGPEGEITEKQWLEEIRPKLRELL